MSNPMDIPAAAGKVGEDESTFYPDDFSSSESSGGQVRLGATTLTLANPDVYRGNFDVVGGAVGGPLPSSSGKGDDSKWDTWDPKAADYNSIQNLLGADIEKNAGAFALGVKDKAKAWSEVPCPFYKGEGNFCWKGPSCRMLHVVENPTDLGKEMITSSYTLDDKPVLNLGMWLQVSVQHVVSPTEFYVIPVESTACICELGFLPRDKTHPEHDNLHKHKGEMDKIRIDSMLEEYGTGLKAFETVQTKLKNILELNWNWRGRQTPYYTKTQLVAVKFSKNSVRTWYRGVVVESDVTQVADRQCPYHLVTLIDVGETLTVRADDLCPLPISLSFYPAMAFKCCLNGVVPVGMRWASTSTKTFKILTAGQHMLMTVAKSYDYEGNCKTIENKPYLVDLMTNWANIPEDLRPTYERPSISVAEVLAENGMAIKLSACPQRPRLNQFLRHNNDFLLAQLNDKKISKPTKPAEGVRVFELTFDLAISKANVNSTTRQRSKSF